MADVTDVEPDRSEVAHDGAAPLDGGYRRVFALDLAALLLVLASLYFAWQTAYDTYAGGSFSFDYYVYGTQCATIATSYSCTTTYHLADALRATEYLVILGAVLAFIGCVLARVTARVVSRIPSLATATAVVNAGGLVAAFGAAIVFANYTYATGTGLWTFPSGAGLGWYLAVVAGFLFLAGLSLAIVRRRRWRSGSPPVRSQRNAAGLT